MQSVIYNIHSWISMLIISVQICTRGTALRMADFPPMMISVYNTYHNTNGQWRPTFWVPLWQNEPPQEESPLTTSPAFCSSMAAFIILMKPHNRGQVAPTSGEQSNDVSDWMTPGIYSPMKARNIVCDYKLYWFSITCGTYMVKYSILSEKLPRTSLEALQEIRLK